MGLFWKIFVSFMAAIVATLVGSVYASLRLAGPSVDETFVDPDPVVIGQMQAALDRGGRGELWNWLNNNRRLSQNRIVLVFDQRTRDELLGRATPFALSVLLRTQPVDTVWSNWPRDRGSDRSGDRDRDRNQRPAGGQQRGPGTLTAQPLVPPLVGPNGDIYRYFFVNAPKDVFGILIWPDMQVAIVAIALLAAAATAFALATYLSSPIVRVRSATRALAAGMLDTRVGAPFNRRKDEVGTLARDFDTMAERIQALVTDKETLLRDVSHELRSPLARIRVALALAQRRTDAAAQKDLDRIEREAEKLDALVGQVMTLSRLRTATEPTRKTVELGALARAVVEDARFEHAERHIDFTANSTAALEGDPEGLKSAVENVVRNALVYSPADQPLEVSLERAGNDVTIFVRDRGPGVAPEDLEKIFEPFYRTDKSRDHRQEGQGIGLAITARVMELHGGTVTAANRDGGGLEVALKLPLGRETTTRRAGRGR